MSYVTLPDASNTAADVFPVGQSVPMRGGIFGRPEYVPHALFTFDATLRRQEALRQWRGLGLDPDVIR